MNYKKGFTLAEMLIAATIVAIIATVMMKTLQSNKPNREQLMLKKVYMEAGRITNQMVNDEKLYNDNGFADTSLVTHKGVSAEGNSKFCKLFKTYLNTTEPSSDSDCSEAIVPVNNTEQSGHFTTTDGVVWYLPIGNFKKTETNPTEEQNLYVDVSGNGAADSNCLSESIKEATETQAATDCPHGPDRFRMIIHPNGKIEVPPDDKIQLYYLRHTTFNKPYKAIKAEALKANVEENKDEEQAIEPQE